VQASSVAIWLAVISFYLLDFALNALQASLRNLVLDITPPEQLSAANAWHSRMSQAGNIFGYAFGFLPLASLPIIRLLGGDQFRKFCVLVMFVLVITVWITCYTQVEEERILQRQPEGYGTFVLQIFMSIQQLAGHFVKSGTIFTLLSSHFLNQCDVCAMCRSLLLWVGMCLTSLPLSITELISQGSLSCFTRKQHAVALPSERPYPSFAVPHTSAKLWHNKTTESQIGTWLLVLEH
jgi:hypothetical protein